MIIYNKTWLNNLELRNQSEHAHQTECVTDEELKNIKEHYPVGFYTPGIFIRIGLFVLTFIIALFSGGLLSLMFASTRAIEHFGWPMFLGVVCYVALEIIVTGKNHYRSGVDDALLWMSGGLLTGGFIWMIGSQDAYYQHPPYLGISVFVFVLSLYFTLRFADVIMSALSILSFFAMIFFAWKNAGAFGMATMPFVIMLVSAIVYVLALRLNNNLAAQYHKACLMVVQIVSLVTLYVAGNYFVIDRLKNSLNDSTPVVHPSAIWGMFFWGWTILLPFVYIARGILKKDVILLRTGLMIIAFAVFTVRNYYHVLPTELALIMAGIVLLAIVYGLVQYLKTTKHGFTSADTNSPHLMDHIKIESLIIGESLGHTPAAPTEPANRFGGGDFGGGGSGGGF
jgi:hypothetical protein